MIKAAIFDMDGLLIDSERIIMQACMTAAQQVGITYTQAEYIELIGLAGIWRCAEMAGRRQNPRR